MRPSAEIGPAHAGACGAPDGSVGLGRESGARSAPSWAEFGPTGCPCSPREQKPAAGPPPGTPAPFPSPPFSLMRAAAAPEGDGNGDRGKEMTRRRRRCLLAGARTRRWVSAPPSSSPLMALGFRARARASRHLGGERQLPVPRSGERQRILVPRIGGQWWRMDEVSHASPSRVRV